MKMDHLKELKSRTSESLSRRKYSLSTSNSIEGLNGFDELRKYIKQGNEFCKEVATIMQERSELESNYAKSLSKLSSKLTKAATGCLGTLASAWSMVASEMEAEAELHRCLAQALSDDIYKPMKNLSESQYKNRKPIEGMVDKSVKTFTDRRSDEAKLKKAAYSATKEREKLCDLLHQGRQGRGKVTGEKELAKLEKTVRKMEDSFRKADRDYHEACQKAESARQEWETSVYKGAHQLQNLEEERISHMQDLMNKYNSHLSVIGPKCVKSCERLGEAVISIDINADLRTVVDQRGTGPNQPEQLLLDYFAEDMNNQMNRDRRRQALQNYLLYLAHDIERELKGKEGVEKLMEVYQNRPNFADAAAQEDARQRLTHVNAMLSFLEACHHKIACAVANVDNRPQPVSKYSEYIEKTKDKQGQTVSILRLPLSMVMTNYAPADTGATNRGSADGGHTDNHLEDVYEQNYDENEVSAANSRPVYSRMDSAHKGKAPEPPGGHSGVTVDWTFSDDDDEFDNYDTASPTVQGQCRAIYDYAACQYDELTIRPGDIITIYEKQDDGWWQGELNGRVGIFPATYVEELPGESMT